MKIYKKYEKYIYVQNCQLELICNGKKQASDYLGPKERMDKIPFGWNFLYTDYGRSYTYIEIWAQKNTTTTNSFNSI